MLEGARSALVEERVVQLDELTNNRSEHLREMYHLVRLRDDVGSVMTFDSDEEDDLEQFMDQFDLHKHPQTGSIMTLKVPGICFSPEASPARDASSLLHGHGTVEARDPTPPHSPPRGEQVGEVSEDGNEDNADVEYMEVDGASPNPPTASKEEPPVVEEIEQPDSGNEGSVATQQQSVGGTPSPPSLLTHNSSTRESPISIPNHRGDEDADELDIISLSSIASQALDRSATPQEQELRGNSDASDGEESTEEVRVDGESDAADDQKCEEDEPPEILQIDEETPEKQFQPPSSISSPSTPARSPLLKPPPCPLLLPSKSPPSSPYVSPAKTAPPPLLIALPPALQRDNLTFTFDDAPAPQLEPSPAPPVLNTRFHKATQYNLPPLSALPIEFNRKGKPGKQRKREKSGSDSGKKDDWVPMGMARWAASVRSNPVYKRLARSTKCLSTRDWNTAVTELKLIRIFDRIEHLKENGRWSFRQPKKQRGVGGLTKTHWDYLMDEMKWLQVDFREERKWKIAVAFELATSVLEWHQAGTMEERIKLGICVLWKRPPSDMLMVADDATLTMDDPMEVVDDGVDQARDTVPTGEYPDIVLDTDDDLHRPDDPANVDDSLQIDSVIADAFDFASRPPEQGFLSIASIAPKVEEIDDSHALRVTGGGDVEKMEVDPEGALVSLEGESTSKKEEPDTAAEPAGLKDNSKNPTLNTVPDSQAGIASVDASVKEMSESLKRLRDPILSLPDHALFIDLDELESFPERSNFSLAPIDADEVSPPDLSAIFPELQPLSLPDIPNSEIISTVNIADGKKKSDKKDKDDPTRRVEETTYTKLHPTSIFMHTKPTLVSALQPSRKWRKGNWVHLEESPIVGDPEVLSSLGDDNACTLFDGRKQLGMPMGPNYFVPGPPKEARKRAVEIPWSATEDNILKDLAERFPNNWRLIADSFNSSRVTITTDKRSPWDCLERWSIRWGNGSLSRPAGGGGDGLAGSPMILDQTPPPPPTATSSHTPMTTRGVKRMAGSSAPGAIGGLAISTSVTAESRKRRRHNLMHETMRKVIKKRESTQKSNLNVRKQSGPIHETHLQYGNNQTQYTPQELCRKKADKDAREAKDHMQQQRRQEELRRQQIQAARMHQQAMQQMQLQQADPTRAQANNLPAQSVPQIRSQVNISQQQRIPTPIGAAPPVSPQMMLQAHQAQAQAQARIMAQAQVAQAHVQAAQNQANGAVNGQAHLSSAYANRGPTASPGLPQATPPRPSAAPNAGVNSPRPPSAQRNPMAAAGVISGTNPINPGNAIPRHSNNMAAYIPQLPNGLYSQEQMAQMLRIQMLTQAQQGQMNIAHNHQPANPTYPQAPPNS